MNKDHWSKIDINKIKSDILDTIIKRSFDSTAQKNKKNRVNLHGIDGFVTQNS